jgi:AcrR family transcriptional regulator
MPSVTRKNQSSRAKRREEIVARVHDAVTTLLEEDGATFTELSVERLVSEADMSRSTFYVYFEDKGDLLRALTEDVITQLLAAASRWWELPPEATRDDVRDALGELWDAYVPNRLVMAAVVEAASYDPGVRETFGAMMERSVAEVAGHIARGQAEGYVHADLDPERTAAWLTWMTERGLYQLVAPGTKAQQRALLESLPDIVWNTLYAGTR